MNQLFERLDRAEKQIAAVKNKVARRDLLKMVKAIDRSMVAADMESVECRRMHKETSRYRELVKQSEELITNLEQHLTLAILMGG
jgi:predicted  nucleic acid-binding Zn-ribbon protein